MAINLAALLPEPQLSGARRGVHLENDATGWGKQKQQLLLYVRADRCAGQSPAQVPASAQGTVCPVHYAVCATELPNLEYADAGVKACLRKCARRVNSRLTIVFTAGFSIGQLGSTDVHCMCMLCYDSHAQHIALSEARTFRLSPVIGLACNIPRLYRETNLPQQNRWPRKTLIRADLASLRFVLHGLASSCRPRIA